MTWSDVGAAPTPARHAFAMDNADACRCRGDRPYVRFSPQVLTRNESMTPTMRPRSLLRPMRIYGQSGCHAPWARQADTLDRLRKAVDRLQRDDQGLEEQRSDAEQLISDAALTKQELQPYADTITQQIAKLGPVPRGRERQ